jgi:hypothetical protein
MTPEGLAHVEVARADGRLASADDGQTVMVIPHEFLDALETRPVAKAFFGTLDRKNLYPIYYRLQTAKRPETRAKRMAQMLDQPVCEERFHLSPLVSFDSKTAVQRRVAASRNPTSIHLKKAQYDWRYLPYAGSAPVDAAQAAVRGGRRESADARHCRLGQAVGPIRPSPSDRTSACGALGGEPQAGGTDLGALRAGGAAASAQAFRLWLRSCFPVVLYPSTGRAKVLRLVFLKRNCP